ncbi:MAG: hypothetical protein L3K19_07145 [Thermoplasmata archaeon]|nr:hypothetical protein [Thermoplasmata archaeon]
MRRRLVVAGAVLLAAGVLLFVVSMVLSTTVSIPASPQAQTLDGLRAFGSATMQVHWSGGVATTVVHVLRCPSSNCTVGDVEVGNATGASGTIVVGVVGGGSYALTVTGPAANVTASINLIGVTPLGLVGMAVLLAGIGLIAIAVRKPPGPVPPAVVGPPPTP